MGTGARAIEWPSISTAGLNLSLPIWLSSGWARVVVPINLRYRRTEIGHIVADCTPRLLITERAQRLILEDAGLGR
jgi:hypothetical protein